jgi:hypothetical protein
MDPVLSHTISKFRIMFIPDALLYKFPAFLGAFVITMLPVTPINLIIFLLILTIIYTTNIFNMSKYDSYSCRDATLVKQARFSLLTLIKNTYFYYFLIAYTVNLLSLVNFQQLNMNAIVSMS